MSGCGLTMSISYSKLTGQLLSMFMVCKDKVSLLPESSSGPHGGFYPCLSGLETRHPSLS